MTRKSLLTIVLVAAAVMAAQSASAQERAARLSRSDQLLVHSQQICPVTGKHLLSMGGPLKAQVGGETVFLCCQGCFQGKVEKRHWDRIQANFIAAQGICPVMKKPLPKNPQSVVVNGRRVFVCCPPCTEKIKSNPEQYLADVDRLVADNLARNAQRRGAGSRR